jgi:uncharacterized RDD family membrane protein YckC
MTATAMSRSADGEEHQGHYAGAATRLLAFAIDQAVAGATYGVATALLSWAVALVTNGALQTQIPGWIAAAGYAVWWFLYFAAPWAASGKTPGMALLGVRVVAADGAPAGPRRAVQRALALPLSFLTLGIGFLPILFGRRHRALHDLLAGTAVVYSWDARAARWRLLARASGGGTA